MEAEKLIIGSYYITPSGSIFEFLGFDNEGDIVMKSFKNCMKIQQGKTTFFRWFSNDLKPYTNTPN